MTSLDLVADGEGVIEGDDGTRALPGCERVLTEEAFCRLCPGLASAAATCEAAHAT